MGQVVIIMEREIREAVYYFVAMMNRFRIQCRLYYYVVQMHCYPLKETKEMNIMINLSDREDDGE